MAVYVWTEKIGNSYVVKIGNEQAGYIIYKNHNKLPCEVFRDGVARQLGIEKR